MKRRFDLESAMIIKEFNLDDIMYIAVTCEKVSFTDGHTPKELNEIAETIYNH